MVTAIVIIGGYAVISVLLVVLSRRRLRPREDVWGDWMRRHGLSAGEAGEVSNGIARGIRYPDPRLRAAAADRAETLLRTDYSDRVTGLVIALYVVPVVLSVVLQPRQTDWLLGAMWLGFSAVVLRRRRGVRRSLEVNGGAGVPE